MNTFFLLILTMLFLLFIIIDILGHKRYKIKRNIFSWCILFFQLIIIIPIAYYGIHGYFNDRSRDEGSLYAAYHYLMNEDIDGALDKISVLEEKDNHRRTIELLAHSLSKDYISVYFITEEILEKGSKDNTFNTRIVNLNRLAKEALSLDEYNEEANALQLKDEYQYQEKEETIQAAIHTEIINTYNQLGLSEQKQRKYEVLFQLDELMSQNRFHELALDEIQNLLQKYNNDQEIMKLAIRYYIHQGYLREARELGENLIKVSKSRENYVIYTDIIAYNTFHNLNIQDANDQEAIKLLEKAETLYHQAERYDINNAKELEKKNQLINQAITYETKAAQLEIHRAINFLNSKKPLFGDDEGLIDLQIAKLKLAIDERDEAQKALYSVLDKAPRIKESSPIYEPLTKVMDAYNQSNAKETSPLLKSAVQALIEAQSQDIIPMNEETINGRLVNYITSTLKYDHIGIHIGTIDTSNYPTIKAFVNVSGQNEGTFGLARDFKEKDFTLIDTQYQIKDFKLSAEESNVAAVAIVMDRSGSMNGFPINDAKAAAIACAENMGANQEMAIIAYDSSAEVISSISNKKSALINGIQGIQADGNTNIADGIMKGIGEIQHTDGTKAIILLSDGQDGNAEAIHDAIDMAKHNQVKIFAVGLGEANQEYMQSIADKTGGKYIHADNSTELRDIYITLQKYILNNYYFEYTITKNETIDPRELIISIPRYQASDEKAYRIKGEAEIIEDIQRGIQPITQDELFISKISPTSISIGEVQQGIEVVIEGGGFDSKTEVSIGMYPLKDIKIESDQLLRGRLEGNMNAGDYDVKVISSGGKIAQKPNAFKVFRAGTTKSVLIGNMTITADIIGQTGDRTFVATGNVMINNFIHATDQITITAYNLPNNIDINKDTRPYLGPTGALSGHSKLYISYAQAKSQGLATHQFANLVMGGKDYVVRDGAFGIGVNRYASDFDLTLHNFDIQIPDMATVKIADCKLFADRLQINIKEINLKQMINNINKGFKGKTSNSNQPTSNRDSAFNYKGFSGAAAIALTGKNIEVGLDIKLNVNDALRFGFFGLKEVGFKLNTLDSTKEYWKISGKVDFSRIVPGLMGSGVAGIGGELGSYYWFPDKMVASAELYPGIPIYNILYIDKLGLKIQGISNLFIQSAIISNEAKEAIFGGMPVESIGNKDVVLAGTLGANINLFKSFKLPVPRDFTKWGELGAIENGEAGINFTKENLYVKADLSILKQKLANAQISAGKNGLDISGAAQLELSMLNCSFGGNVSMGIKVNTQNITTNMGINGHMDVGFLDIHFKGSSNLKIYAQFDGSYFEVEIMQDLKKARFWYDDDGNVFFFNRFHAETFF